ncbi:MAG: hypothetical protein IPL79_10740 [Myxococcales bacterium]|nr:hypothetical protein [Myxococcales bacterium]
MNAISDSSRRTLFSSTMVWRLCVIAVTCGACASTPRRLIYEQTPRRLIFEQALPLRLRGATDVATVELPAIDAARQTSFLLEATIIANCTPWLRVTLPDGVTIGVGDDDVPWQRLLIARRLATPAPTEAVATPPASAPASTSAPVAAPVVAPGRWQVQATESWPGQLEFLRQRQQRCARRKSYRFSREYVLNATTLRIEADVPQESDDAMLHVRLYELGTPAKPEVAAAMPAAATLDVAVVSHAKPTGPAPAPKRERPAPPKVKSAVWVAGAWTWDGAPGKWVWVKGYYREPSERPALRKPSRAAPVVGARWQDGYWVWFPGNGEWKWRLGYWLPPVPHNDQPTEPPPIRGSVWRNGQWIGKGASFVWKAGNWKRPPNPVEVKPPRQSVSATWVDGFWSIVEQAWVWTPGRYLDDRPAPPPAKPEQSGVAPHPHAVWLAGYWRWQDAAYQWIDGRWELPPGEQYVWVPDPPVNGVVTGGRWRIDVTIQVPPATIVVPAPRRRP